MQNQPTPPTADQWVTSPLRNQIKLELAVPASQIWAEVGHPATILNYTTGLEKVETKIDDLGKYTEYTCFYEPYESSVGMVVHSTVVWYEPHRGWASLDTQPSPIGFLDSLLFVTLEEVEDKTILTWSMHYNNATDEELECNVGGLNHALTNEIAAKLIERFGGRMVESYTYAK